MNNIYVIFIVIGLIAFFVFKRKKKSVLPHYQTKEFDTLLMADISIYFKEKYKEVIKQHPNLVPVALKTPNNSIFKNSSIDKLGTCIVCTFYDENTGEIISEETLVCSYNKLDETLSEQFGNETMIVFK